MKTQLVIAASLVSLTLTASTMRAQNVPPAAAVPSAGSGAQNSNFMPGFDDGMTMLVQPRHLKLYYAGTQKNWELAEFELGELRSALQRITQMYPKYANNSVDEALRVIMAPKMLAVDTAIRAADSKQFAKAYGDLTEA